MTSIPFINMDIGLILASKSPRRKEILSNVGLDFEIVVSDTDESVPNGTLPFDAVMEISKRKALAVQKALGDKAKGKIILGADTVVALDNEIIGKPKSGENAVEILKRLSGNRHVVYTGFTLVKDDFVYSDFESTNVYFRALSEKEIVSYVKSGEPMDKAGAYGIQQLGALLVNKIHGDYFNVMGLPINKISVTLSEKFGINLLNNN